MRVLVTGATGFVGSLVVERLVERGDEVRALALPETLDRLPCRDRVELHVGSLADPAALAEATRGVEVVYHMAAIHLSALRAAADPRELRAVNVEGTHRLLRAAAAGGVRRLVFTSSVAVYNGAPWPFLWPVGETWPLRTMGDENLRSYAQSKIDAEALIGRFHHERGLETVILRSAAVYGAGAPWVERTVRGLAVNPWSALTRAGRFACNQWIHRSDLARAVVAAGTGVSFRNELCNVAGGELFSARDILAGCARALGQKEWTHLPALAPGRREGYSLRYDLTRAATRLGFAPRVKLEDGLREVLSAMDPAPRLLAPGRAAPGGSAAAEVERF